MAVRPASIRYVALGDSYTIGTSVGPADRWPDQLVRTIGDDPPALSLVANLGVNEYTSADLIRDQLPVVSRLDPGFASILIGVNDVVRGVPTRAYQANVTTILEQLLTRLSANRIVTVAIPDYTVTPAGANYGDPRQQHDGIVANNEIMASASAARGIRFVDIFDLSLLASTDRRLVADDGLHPSRAQYAAWVERIAPVVKALIAS